MDLSIVIPTYNEKENIPILLKRINLILKKNKIDAEIIVVDDNSPDGTGDLLENLKKNYKNLKVIHREKKLGLCSGVLDGFSKSDGNVLAVMDADLSHPPEKIPEMFSLIKNNEADFVIGSRYTKGGNIEGWGTFRKIQSKGAILLTRLFTPIKDTMTGFFMIKKDCLENKTFNPKGLHILMELIIKANYKKVKEIPITFINRKKGKSKSGIKEIGDFISNLISYLPYRRSLINQFLKFSFVGLIGTLINLLVLFYLTEKYQVYYLFSATIAFFIALSSNFFLNKTWTFKEKFNHQLIIKYKRYLTVNLLSLGVNLIFLFILTSLLNIHYLISQIISIALALSINFTGNKSWTFSE